MEKLIKMLLALPKDTKNNLANKDIQKQLHLILDEIKNIFHKIDTYWNSLSEEAITADIYLPILKELLPNDKQQLQILSNKLNDVGDFTGGMGNLAFLIGTMDQVVSIKNAETDDAFDLKKMRERLPANDKKQNIIEKYLTIAKAVTSPTPADIFFSKHSNAPAKALEEASYQDILSRSSYSDGTIDSLKKGRIDFWLSVLDLFLIKQDLAKAEAILKSLQVHQVDNQLATYHVSDDKKNFPRDTLEKYETLKSKFMKIHIEQQIKKEQNIQLEKEQQLQFGKNFLMEHKKTIPETKAPEIAKPKASTAKISNPQFTSGKINDLLKSRTVKNKPTTTTNTMNEEPDWDNLPTRAANRSIDSHSVTPKISATVRGEPTKATQTNNPKSFKNSEFVHAKKAKFLFTTTLQKVNEEPLSKSENQRESTQVIKKPGKSAG